MPVTTAATYPKLVGFEQTFALERRRPRRAPRPPRLFFGRRRASDDLDGRRPRRRGAGPRAVRQDVLVQEELVVLEAGGVREPARPLGAPVGALLHGPHHRSVASIALSRRAAHGLPRVPLEKVEHHVVGTDLLGRVAERARLERVRAGPRVAAAVDHDQDHAGVVVAVEVLVQDDVLRLPHPAVALAAVVLHPLLDGVRHR
mmetsp:Transcript_108253/g.329039  ORF Transcript_108253/g.329039 Transcript_108253/m.329039 type:complete len:202 (-) Transcript_108253:764-1369(-)